MTRAPFLALLLAAALLAGCLAPERGCAFFPPAPEPGAVLAFEGDRGFLWSPGTGPFVHAAFGPEGPAGGPILLEPGSRVDITVGTAPVPRLGQDGATHPAWEIRYSVEVPGRGRLDAAVEWIDAATGRLLAGFQPTILEQEGKPMHQTRYLRDDLPPVLLTSMWWNRTWHEGDEARHTLRAEETTPPAEQGRTVALETRVVRARMAAGVCTAQVEGSYDNPADGYRTLISMDWRDSSPLPDRLRFDYQPMAEGAPPVDPLELRLVTTEATGAGALPAWRQTPLPPGQLATAPLADGFLAGSLPFPHGYQEARQAALADVTAGPWLRDHPDAVAIEATHVMGSNDIRDTWRIRWADPSASLRVTVDFLESLLPALPTRTTVHAMAESGAALPAYPAVRLDEMVRLHRLVYGQDPEVLDCNLATASCTMGTHDATARPRSGGVGGGIFVHIGLGFDMAAGRVLQEDALGPMPLA